jgi:type I restriction-modification system DNA methylase subunit
LKNNETYDLSISKLLSIDSYIELYDKDERKVRQDYDSLISYSDKLNKRLFDLKIPEPDRALLLSAVLIALNNKRFIDSFKECELSSELCSLLVNVVETEMKKNNLDNYSIETVIKSFNFICNNPFFTKDITILSDLIREIDTNVNQFVQTKKYYDILGQFYVKFLEKCNSDKKLGIVLTPNHITEFMGDLVHLSSESVLYENCTGTGGFVISGIKKMIDSSSGEFEVKEKIKTQNFIGVEYQPQIYSLLVCKMMLNGLSP